MNNKKLGVKLKQMREELEYTLEKASKKLGFNNYQTLLKIESGEREVKAAELFKFSKAYFFNLSDFLSRNSTSQELKVLWRKKPENKKEVENQIKIKAENYKLLEDLLKIEPPEKIFYPLTKDNIRTKKGIADLSDDLRKHLSLGSRPAFTLQKILEQNKRIKILYEPLPEGSAMTLNSESFGSVLVINEDEPPWRRNFDLAHELFHLLTWDLIPVYELMDDEESFKEIENKAENFAAFLLLPEKEFKEAITEKKRTSGKFRLSDVVDISNDFGVSTQAVLYRMAYLNKISWEKANVICNDEEFKSLNKKMRKSAWGEKPSSERFISLAVNCLRKGLISKGKFCEILGIEREETEDFLTKRGFMVEEGNEIEIMST